MIGKTISHYKILEKLGEGGMGVVYKAEDTKLKRTVALKFLRTQALEDEEGKIRFIHEARAAAALDHPNICTVYEVNEFEGHTYIAMAHIEGENLRDTLRDGPVPLDRALEIAVQAAEGLRAAHQRGIIHRDIKSANVMVTPAGVVKLMDFGLAKTAGATKVTKTGATLGTVSYMSPEQARGDEVDHRTDIWSLGAIMYEMLTGKLPFRGNYEPAVVYSLLNEDPEPITSITSEIPLEVEQMVCRALTRDPEKRYQSTEKLIADIEELRERLDLLPRRSQLQLKLIRNRKKIAFGAAAVVVAAVLVVLGLHYFGGTARAIDSIAVLPFEDLSGDSEQEYLAEGMTRELTATLGQISSWTVKSSSSMMRYKKIDMSPSDIAAEVDAKALLAGSIQSLPGDRVKAIVELIDGATEKLLWTQPFECELREFNNMMNDIARITCERVGIAMKLSENERLTSSRPVIPKAHELLLKANYIARKWRVEDYEQAAEYAKKAIEIDPDYAEAYAFLADCYVYFGWSDHISKKEASLKATALIRKALEIDDELSEAHCALANVRFWFDWDWVGAEDEYKRAIELNPSNALAHGEYAWNLMVRGCFEEAFDELKLYLQIDPTSYTANMSSVIINYCARRYDNAIAHFRQYTELEPDEPRIYSDIVLAYAQLGKYDDAIRARQKVMTLSKDPPEKVAANIAALDSAYSESGFAGYWMWSLERWKGNYDRYPMFPAMCYAQLGDKDQAFTWLEKAFENRDGLMPQLKVNPVWDPLRDDPRYQDLLRRMNFTENKNQE